MRRRSALVIPAIASAAVAAAAAPAVAEQPRAGAAATPTVTVPPLTTPAPAPKPKPRGGSMTIGFRGGLATRKLRYYARGQRIVISGRVRPFVPRQAVEVLVVRKGKVVSRQRVRVRKARRGGGFVARFTARRRGTLRVVARHRGTDRQAAFRARDKRLAVVLWRAGAGAAGTRVLLLQRALRSLAFAVPVSGRYDGGTGRAVLAFRKTNNMGRTGYASPAVYARVFRHQGAFRLRHPRAGRHVEFDWSRQVLALADHGRPWRVYHASSGKPSTPTVFGAFRFYRKQPGINSHGMVDSNYFIGGYAIHGYAEVPPYAASHGCIRVPIPNARAIYDHVSLGERIFVYR